MIRSSGPKFQYVPAEDLAKRRKAGVWSGQRAAMGGEGRSTTRCTRLALTADLEPRGPTSFVRWWD
jgi:hypothetical protein